MSVSPMGSPVVWTYGGVGGGAHGPLPAHKVPVQLLHLLQSLPLTQVRVHQATWQRVENNTALLNTRANDN